MPVKDGYGALSKNRNDPESLHRISWQSTSYAMPEGCQGSRGCLSLLEPTAKRSGFQSKAPPLFLRATNSFAREVLLKDSVFLLKIVGDHLLLAIHQAGKTHQNRVPRLKYCVHTVQLSCLWSDFEWKEGCAEPNLTRF